MARMKVSFARDRGVNGGKAEAAHCKHYHHSYRKRRRRSNHPIPLLPTFFVRCGDEDDGDGCEREIKGGGGGFLHFLFFGSISATSPSSSSSPDMGK